MNRNEVKNKIDRAGVVAGAITTDIFNKYTFTSEDTITFENEILLIETDSDIIMIPYQEIYDITIINR